MKNTVSALWQRWVRWWNAPPVSPSSVKRPHGPNVTAHLVRKARAAKSATPPQEPPTRWAVLG